MSEHLMDDKKYNCVLSFYKDCDDFDEKNNLCLYVGDCPMKKEIDQDE